MRRRDSQLTFMPKVGEDGCFLAQSLEESRGWVMSARFVPEAVDTRVVALHGPAYTRTNTPD